MKKLLLMSGVTMASCSVFGQNIDDAARYSFLNPTGTARFSSMGGAFGALGADFSSISVNPGGIGVYTKSEFSFSPSFYYQGSETDFNGSSVRDGRANFNFGNAGIIASWRNRRAEESKWKSFTFGFGLNRTNNFYSSFTIDGDNSSSSLLDVYHAQAEGRPFDALDPFGSDLAWQTYLLDTIPGGDGTSYFTQIPAGGVRQVKSIDREGAMGEVVVAMGANYNNKLYIGGSLGITYLRFFQTSEYIEDTPDSGFTLDKFYLDETLKTTGSGYNLKLGAIYRAQDWLRFGAAVHTPTFWRMQDTWSSSITALYDSVYLPEIIVNSPSGNYSYNLTTPMKGIGSIAVIIKKKGIISADYEFVDYSMARLNSSQYKYVDENKVIQQNLSATGNVRLGAELRLDPFAIRAGYALLGNPYRSNISSGGAQNFSLGAGVRGEGYFVDVAYVLSKQSSDYYIYDPSLVNSSRVATNSNSLMFTVGFRY